MQYIPLYARAPEALRPAWRELIQRFLREKRFEGAGGFEVTDEIRLAIASQACLLLLNRKSRCYPRLRSIIVYPQEFTVPTHVPFSPGHYLASTEDRLGESWRTGAVVLAWRAVDPANARGRNVVLHEFAHQLDLENGAVDGIPELPSARWYAEWARTWQREWMELRRNIAAGQFSVFDSYAGTNEAEFFAVATELFFEQPALLCGEAPALYEELRQFFGVDPKTWSSRNGTQIPEPSKRV